MKRVRINQGKVGLIFKNDNYLRAITKGTYWLGFNNNVIIYDLTMQFFAPIASEILLKDKSLKKMLTIIEVKDSEIALLYENGIFKNVFTAGRYFFWNGLIDFKFVIADLSKIYITEKIDKTVFRKAEMARFVQTFEVASYEKAILLVDGIYTKTLIGGTYFFWKNDTSIKMVNADMRQLQLEIAGQELLTKDKAAIRINFFTQYKVVDIENALLSNKDFEKQLYIMMQLVLRAYVGAYTLDELLERKESITESVFTEVKTEAAKLGVNVLNCGIRDVILTGEMKDIMNQVLMAQKKAQANVIVRREETASTRSLLNTAKLMEENEMLFKLKEMEYVEKIADKVGEISISGNGGMASQLKEVFSVSK